MVVTILVWGLGYLASDYLFLFWGFAYPLLILSTLWETRPYRQLGLNGLRPE